VSREGIGLLGMCGSGGFAISAAQVDRRIKAVATVSMYDISRAQTCGFQDSLTEEDPDQILDAIAEQRYADFEGSAPALTPRGAPIGFDETTDPIGREFGEFYSTLRGYTVPNAGHVDLYDKIDLIPFDKFDAFFTENLAATSNDRVGELIGSES
jgi:fermentation-respiration switch protein FrsA (DUF1100 family)